MNSICTMRPKLTRSSAEMDQLCKHRKTVTTARTTLPMHNSSKRESDHTIKFKNQRNINSMQMILLTGFFSLW